MKQEDYVSYDVAKLLKEKGYNEPCDSVYTNVTLVMLDNRCASEDWNHLPILKNANLYTSAPSLWDAQKWLREEHNIHVDVGVAGDSSNDADGNVCEEWTFWMFDIYTIDSLHHFDVEDNREYSSYEQALNEGIKAALNFIKIEYNQNFED